MNFRRDSDCKSTRDQLRRMLCINQVNFMGYIIDVRDKHFVKMGHALIIVILLLRKIGAAKDQNGR